MDFKRLFILVPFLTLLVGCVGGVTHMAPVIPGTTTNQVMVGPQAPLETPSAVTPPVSLEPVEPVEPVEPELDCQTVFTFGKNPTRQILHIKAGRFGCGDFPYVVEELRDSLRPEGFTSFTIAFDGPSGEEGPTAVVTVEGFPPELAKGLEENFYDEAGADEDYYDTAQYSSAELETLRTDCKKGHLISCETLCSNEEFEQDEYPTCEMLCNAGNVFGCGVLDYR